MFAVHVEILQAVRANCSSAKKNLFAQTHHSRHFRQFPDIFCTSAWPQSTRCPPGMGPGHIRRWEGSSASCLGQGGCCHGQRWWTHPQQATAQLWSPATSPRVSFCIHTPETFCILAAKCCFALGEKSGSVFWKEYVLVTANWGS